MCRQPSVGYMALAVALMVTLCVVSASGQPAGGYPGISALPGSLSLVSERAISGVQEVSTAVDRPRHITLEQAKQQASRAISPLNRLSQLSVEAAKQHRLGVQAEYFPKISATAWNFHFNKFMGQTLAIQRPVFATLLPTGIPLVGENFTLVTATVVQPITPLFKIHEAVKIARADERIARAKAGMSVSQTSDAVEKSYFDLLIAERQEALAKAHVRKTENGRMIASTTPAAVNLEKYQTDVMEASKQLAEASSKLKEAAASLNDLLGFAPGTELELASPSPLVENLTFEEVSDGAVATNPDVIEAEQNLVKARAASKLAKLDYVPEVAAVWGYTFNNNVIPALPTDFSWVGVMASYNVFDFGKREHTIKERNAQVGMAAAAVELTKAKVAAGLKQTYFELVRSREVSDVTRETESALRVIAAKYASDDPDFMASSAKLQIEMLRSELEHRQAYAKVRSLMGSKPDGR